MVDSVKKPNAQGGTDAEKLGELKDIELPVSPAFDWLELWIDLGLIVMVVVLLSLLFMLAKRSNKIDQYVLTGPFVLRWQLWQLKRHANLQDHDLVGSIHSRSLYDWSTRLTRIMQAVQVRSPAAEELALVEQAQQLKKRCEYMAFANEPVSRETYFETIEHAQVLLHKVLSMKFMVTCTVKGLFKSLFMRGRI